MLGTLLEGFCGECGESEFGVDFGRGGPSGVPT